MKNNFITKIIGATLAFAMMIGGAVGINAAKEAKEVNAATTYEQLTSIANIDETAQYVLGIDGTGFHYQGTSSWGKTALPSAQTPFYYTLKKANDGNSFTAETTIDETKYYLQIPTSNTFSMATSAGTNTDIIIGTTQVSGTNYAVANKTTTARHLRINGTSGLRSYAGTTGSMAFFYKVVSDEPSKIATTTTITAPNNKTTLDLAASPVDTVQLSATVTYASGTITNPSITWTSSNANVATVNADGVVTAVAKGNTTITASYAGDGTYNASSSQKQITVINSKEVMFDFKEIAAQNSWVNATAYNPVILDGVTITADNGNANNAKYYTDGNTWRMYTGGALTITPPSGKSISNVTSNPVHTFTIASGGVYASASFTAKVEFKSITVTLDVEKILDSITASITNTSRVWRTNDVVAASDLTVVPHYTDGTDGAAITDGTGVTVTNGTLQNVGSNTVNVSFGGKSTTVTVNALSSSIVEWTITGEIGETVKSTAYNLSGLTLHGWYDNGKTDEASSSVVSAYELVANPAVAGSTPDENNTIEVKVYANSDTGHTNCLKTFENVAAPIIIAARGSEQNPYTVAQARAAIDAGTGVNGVYVTGIVSEIVEPYTTQYKNISYNISADGLTTSEQLEAFRGKSYNGDDFASADDIEIGAVVVVYGNLIKYNSTYELAQNNKLISYVAPVRTLESIALSGTYPTEFLTGDVFSADGMIVTATYDNGSQRIVTDDVTFTGYNMSEAGQQTVTVSYEENDVTKTVTYNITVTFVNRISYNSYNETAIAEGDYILFYNGNAVKNSITSKRADYQGVTQNNGTILSELDTIVWHIASSGNYYTIYNAAADKYLASTGSKNEAALLDDATTDNALWSIEISGDSNKTYDFVNKARAASGSNPGNKYLRYNAGYGFACYATGTAGALSLYKRDSLSYLNSTSFSSEAKLIANETGEGVDSVAIRFTTKVSKYIWNSIVADKGVDEFGIMLFKTRNGTHLSAEEKFNAEADPNNPTTVVAINNTAFGLTLDDNDAYYSFNVKVNIAGASSYDLKFCASPYVVVDGTHYFLGNMDPSVNSLAQAGALESTLSPEALAILAGN